MYARLSPVDVDLFLEFWVMLVAGVAAPAMVTALKTWMSLALQQGLKSRCFAWQGTEAA